MSLAYVSTPASVAPVVAFGAGIAWCTTTTRARTMI